MEIKAKLETVTHGMITYKINDVKSVERLTVAGTSTGFEYDQIYKIAYPTPKAKFEGKPGDDVVIELDLKLCPYTLEIEANYTRVRKDEITQPYEQKREMGYYLRNPYGQCINCN